MEFFLHMLERGVGFAVASEPLILVFLMLKIFNLPPKAIAVCLLLNLSVSIFFWLKLKDIYIALYQSVPYISSFIWIWAEDILRKRKENKKS